MISDNGFVTCAKILSLPITFFLLSSNFIYSDRTTVLTMIKTASECVNLEPHSMR